jgi:hypothetical protein
MNNSGLIGIVEIDKLIITNCELDELKELIVVSKYFSSIVFEQFPKLHKTFILLDEYKIIDSIIPTKNWICYYYNTKIKQINRKIYEFIFRLLRKNDIILVNKIIHHADKCNLIKDNIKGMFCNLFHKIISENYTNEQILITNLIKISPPNVDWKDQLECFEYWFEDLHIDAIILTILDLLKAAIFLNNEDFIVTLIKTYYEYDLYNWEENPKGIHLELVQLIESLEKSSTIYSDIVEYGLY